MTLALSLTATIVVAWTSWRAVERSRRLQQQPTGRKSDRYSDQHKPRDLAATGR